MGKLIELHMQHSSLKAMPVDLFALRWRLRLISGVEITSSFLPEHRYPSIRETMRDYANHVDKLFIDGRHRYTGAMQTFLECPGAVLASFSYKGMMSAITQNHATIGIEVEDIEGTRYLVLRDGKAHIEERESSHVANDN